MEVINFYRVGDAYGCFSNFAPYPMTIAGQADWAAIKDVVIYDAVPAKF